MVPFSTKMKTNVICDTFGLRNFFLMETKLVQRYDKEATIYIYIYIY